MAGSQRRCSQPVCRLASAWQVPDPPALHPDFRGWRGGRPDSRHLSGTTIAVPAARGPTERRRKANEKTTSINCNKSTAWEWGAGAFEGLASVLSSRSRAGNDKWPALPAARADLPAVPPPALASKLRVRQPGNIDGFSGSEGAPQRRPCRAAALDKGTTIACARRLAWTHLGGSASINITWLE